MTRAERLAKAAAWERMARWVDRSVSFFGLYGTRIRTRSRRLISTDDVLSVQRENASAYWEDRAIMSLHCLNEAARLRSGVPV